jgi:hypothetical protein
MRVHARPSFIVTINLPSFVTLIRCFIGRSKPLGRLEEFGQAVFHKEVKIQRSPGTPSAISGILSMAARTRLESRSLSFAVSVMRGCFRPASELVCVFLLKIFSIIMRFFGVSVMSGCRRPRIIPVIWRSDRRLRRSDMSSRKNLHNFPVRRLCSKIGDCLGSRIVRFRRHWYPLLRHGSICRHSSDPDLRSGNWC